MSLPVPTEEIEQMALVRYLELKGHKFTAIPNSTYTTSWKQKAKNKATGLRPGLPDMVIIIKDNLVWVELKRTKGGVLSNHQKEWIKALERAGQTIIVAKGAEQAIKFIQSLEKGD